MSRSGSTVEGAGHLPPLPSVSSTSVDGAGIKRPLPSVSSTSVDGAGMKRPLPSVSSTSVDGSVLACTSADLEAVAFGLVGGLGVGRVAGLVVHGDSFDRAGEPCVVSQPSSNENRPAVRALYDGTSVFSRTQPPACRKPASRSAIVLELSDRLLSLRNWGVSKCDREFARCKLSWRRQLTELPAYFPAGEHRRVNVHVVVGRMRADFLDQCGIGAHAAI
ncbi:MAG: hypothetical protein QOH10_2919 [Actinomycetota bacterium]|nr:hypothetical protein [Actinomycetota bacterium]